MRVLKVLLLESGWLVVEGPTDHRGVFRVAGHKEGLRKHTILTKHWNEDINFTGHMSEIDLKTSHFTNARNLQPFFKLRFNVVASRLVPQFISAVAGYFLPVSFDPLDNRVYVRRNVDLDDSGLALR